MRRQQRTTFILAAIVAALLAFVWFYERNTLSSKELGERHGKLLERFVRARLSKVEIQRHGTTYSIERRRADDDEAGEGPFWGLAQPVHADADDDAVSSLLGELEYLEARRTLTGLAAADRHRMGLDHPRLRAWLTVAGERQLLSVGAEDARDEGVFVATDDPTRAYVVGKDLFEALDKDADDFRDKRLFGGTSSLRVANAMTLHGGPDGTLTLARDGTRWSFSDSQSGWASRDTVEAILGALDDLRAARFVHERTSPSILSETHLGEPDSGPSDSRATYEIDLRAPPSFSEQADGGAGEAGVAHPHTFRFRLGAPCVGHSGERYAIATRDGVEGPVVCVASAELELELGAPAASLRDARVVTSENETVDRISIAAGGHRLDVRREGDGFRYTVDGSHDEQGASQEGVAHWLDALRALRATEFVPVATDAHGTDHGRAQLTIAGDDGTVAETVTLGASDVGGAWVRRGEEPVALRVGAEAAELLVPSPVAIRDPRPGSCGLDDSLTSMTVVREDGTRTELARNGDHWEITSPPHQTATEDAARMIARLVTSAEALRWAASHARAPMGLSRPRLAVTTHATAPEPRSCTLRLGAETAGGVYATLEVDSGGIDQPVFVVSGAIFAEVDRLVAGVDAGVPAP